MAAASNAQVQAYADAVVRPLDEQLRKVYLLAVDARAALDDIYENLTNSPTWTDNRPDAPPHLLGPNDVLAWNTFLVGLIKLVEGTFTDVTEANSFAAQWAVILKGCVRPPQIA